MLGLYFSFSWDKTTVAIPLEEFFEWRGILEQLGAVKRGYVSL